MQNPFPEVSREDALLLMILLTIAFGFAFGLALVETFLR
jgi:hypothetical protein